MEAECNCAKISGCVISFSFSFLLFVDKKVYKFPITGKMLLSEVLGTLASRLRTRGIEEKVFKIIITTFIYRFHRF